MQELAVVLLATFLVIAVALYVAFIAIRRNLVRRAEAELARLRLEEWKKANPATPPLTVAQFDAFCRWYEQQALPALRLDVGEASDARPGGSRLGGPAWLARGEAWPTGTDGQPLDFLAQLDFSELPPLPDYPTSGLLQFFIGRDDLYGANFDNLAAGNFRVIWREALSGDGALQPQPPAGDADYTPFSSRDVRQNGLPLAGVRMEQLPPVSNWTIERDQPEVTRSETSDLACNFMEQRDNPLGERHHVGGYPELTQSDFRSADKHAALDRVLLQLWSYPDRVLMWGDMGQSNFIISRADLMARNFSRVTYHWDCT